MATTKAQRIGIWIIAVFMAVGTIGSFAIIVLANQNSQNDQSRFNELYAQYQKDVQAHQATLSEKYLPKLNEVESRVAAFDKESVTKLVKTDLTKGSGDTITEESSFSAYYIGWNPSGKMFDSSFNETGDGLKDPLSVYPGGVIEGWTQGVDGMKEGGIRELTIPYSLAYKDQARGEDIPANTPLKFIVLIVPAEDTNNAPQMPEELTTLYARLYGNQ